MAYSENIKNNNARYLKASQHRVAINWLKKDFDTNIEPAIRESGLPVSTFIKEAVREKIARECWDIPNGNTLNEFIERLIRLYMITSNAEEKRYALIELENSPTFKAIQGGDTAYILNGVYSVFWDIDKELKDAGVKGARFITWEQLELIDKVKKIGF